MNRTTIDEYDNGYVLSWNNEDGHHERVVSTKAELKTLLVEIFTNE